MKRILLIPAILALSISARASVYTFSFDGINAPIPDGNFAGYQNSQLLSADSFDVLNIAEVNVAVNISGSYNGDLYGYLVHDTGFAVLLNRVGRTDADSFGYVNNGFAMTFSDSAAHDVHDYQNFEPDYNLSGQLTGLWQPDGRTDSPNSVTQLDENRTALLSSFAGLNPSGTWTLFLADVSFGDQSALVSWQLEIQTVPEPTSLALGLFAAVAVAVRRCSLGRSTSRPSQTAPR